MAVFTAIASAIVGAITGAGFAATFGGFFAGTLGIGATIGVALVSGGLAVATAKASGMFKPPSIQAAKDPGVKVQLAPSTDNRVPVFYGRVNSGAIMVDAGIKNQNNTMVYVMVIGEKTDSGIYTVNEIRRGDAKLNFTGGYASATSPSVISITDPNATASTRVSGKMRVRVYAGNAQSSVNQIFPPGGTKVAAQTLLPTIDATTNYEDLVYAVFEMDYDPENGLTQLGTLTYDITNSLDDPANVLKDYLQNDRYGAGLDATLLDLPSFNDMFDYCNTLVDYTTAANVTNQHVRWQIDGMLSTYVDVKSNIDKICQSSATYFTYDNKTGKFKVVPNRAATTAEKSAAFVFDDDNIIGKINISSTELYSLYNRIEAEYPSIDKNDQTDIVIVDTPSGDRNPNEPDNPLQTRYDLVNENSRVYNLANIDLRQSRLSTVLEFEASYEAMQVDVGDVVKVTNSIYGYSNKLFRCMRVSEMESAEGMLKTKVVLLEYDDSVYEHNVVQSYAAPGLPGIPGWWTGIWGNANITIPGNITVTDPGNATANIIDPGNGNVIGNIDYGNIDWGNIDFGGVPGSPNNPNTPVVTVPITTPNIPDLSHICVDMMYDLPNGVRGHICNDVAPPMGNTVFPPNTNVNVTVPIPDPVPTDPTLPGFPLIPDFNVNFDIWGVGSEGGVATDHTYIPSFPVFNPGKINLGDLQDITAGFQVDSAPAANTSIADAAADPNGTALGNANSIFTPAVVVDLGSIDFGEYSALSSIVPFGAVDPNAATAVNFVNSADVNYEEIYLSNNQPTGIVINDFNLGTGITALIDTSIPPVLKDDFKFEMSPARGQSVANAVYAAANVAPPTGVQYLPTNVSLQPFANSSLTTAVGARAIKFKGDILRASKGDSYRDLR